MPLVATSVDDHPSLRVLSAWATERCPITVVHEHDGPVVDLDALRIGVDTESGAVDTAALTSALTGAQAARGSALNTADGVAALISCGVQIVVAPRRLPLQLRIIQHQVS